MLVQYVNKFVFGYDVTMILFDHFVVIFENELYEIMLGYFNGYSKTDAILLQ